MSLNLLFRRFRELHAEAKYGIGLKGQYKIEICRHGQVVRKPFGDRFLPNLFTNIGLDMFFNPTTGAAWAGTLSGSMAAYARIGSGSTTPAFTDTQLVTQLASTITRYSGGGIGNTYDTVNGASTYTDIYEFPAEVGAVTYRELGLGPAASGSGATTGLLTRALFPSAVTLNAGDNMRLTYVYTISIPCLITPVTVSLTAVNGFNVSGSMKMAGVFSNIFGTLPSTGGSLSGNAYQTNFGFGTITIPILLSACTFPAVNANFNTTFITGGVGNTSALGTYTAGSFTRNASLIFTPSQPSSTVSNVNGIWIAGNQSSSGGFGLALALTSAQTKANTNTLTITVSCTMTRI